MRIRIMGLAVAMGVVLTACPSNTPPVAIDSTTSTTRAAKTSGTVAPGQKPTQTKRGTGGKPYTEQLQISIEDIQEFWDDTMPKAYRGKTYQRIPDNKIYAATSKNPAPGCGKKTPNYEDVKMNAFYCPLGQYIAYDDELLFPKIYEDFGAFSVSMALAHEWGHAIQDQVGIIRDYKTILIEQQADCFAGAWTKHSLEDSGAKARIQPSDLQSALAALIFVRDKPGGDVLTSKSAHGSSFDRINAFSEGFENGASRCAEYPDKPPSIMNIQYGSAEDKESQGNMAYDKAIEVLTAELNDFWAASAPGFEPVNDLVRYSSSTQMPTCAGRVYTEDEALNHAVFCYDTNFVGYDETWMKESVNGIGDFAIGLVFAQQWAKSLQVQQGLSKDKVESKQGELQQSCFAGAWAGDIVNGGGEKRPSKLTLSPGDLDEGMIAFLAFSETPDQSGKTDRGSAFEKAAAFREGFLSKNGLVACDNYSSK